MPYEVLNSKTTYNGVIVNVTVDTLTLPDGSTTKRETVIRGNASAILPIDNNGNIILVKQYRHAAKRLTLEIPAGMLDDGEDPLLCAAREMEEEIGYKSDNITLLFSTYPALGFCTEIIHIYKAEDLYAGKQNFDSDEFIEIIKMPLTKAVELIHNGEIVDGKSICAIMAYAVQKATNYEK